MSDINNEIAELEKQLSKTRNESERGILYDKIKSKKEEIEKAKNKDMKKEILVNKEAPVRIDHNKITRGDVVISDRTALF